MTNEEREKHIRIANMLIGVINDVNTPMLMYQIEKDVTKEALENYIKMLEQQPCEDCISRAEVNQEISYISYEFEPRANDIVDRMRERCKNLPSVTPQPKSGEWIDEDTEQGALGFQYKRKRCSKCGWSHSLLIPKNYCPNCGADMRESEE